LTVTGLSAQSRPYDGTTVAAITGTPILSGVFGSDDVVLNGTAAGSFNNKNVGTAKPVSVSGLSISRTNSGNYAFTLCKKESTDRSSGNSFWF